MGNGWRPVLPLIRKRGRFFAITHIVKDNNGETATTYCGLKGDYINVYEASIVTCNCKRCRRLYTAEGYTRL